MSASARPKIVSSTIDLVRRYGVAGTGITRLLEHSGVARRTVYLNFPGGKAQMIAAATESAGDGIASMMAQVLAGADLEVALDVFVQWWKDVLIGSDFNAGCPVAAAALGRDEAPDAADIAADVFVRWENILAAALRDRVSQQRAQSLAAMAIAAIEGAVIIGVAKRSTTPLDQVRVHLAELVSDGAGR